MATVIFSHTLRIIRKTFQQKLVQSRQSLKKVKAAGRVWNGSKFKVNGETEAAAIL